MSRLPSRSLAKATARTDRAKGVGDSVASSGRSVPNMRPRVNVTPEVTMTTATVRPTVCARRIALRRARFRVTRSNAPAGSAGAVERSMARRIRSSRSDNVVLRFALPELGRELSAGSVERRLGGALADAHHGGDLFHVQPQVVPENRGLALLPGELAQCPAEVNGVLVRSGQVRDGRQPLAGPAFHQDSPQPAPGVVEGH